MSGVETRVQALERAMRELLAAAKVEYFAQGLHKGSDRARELLAAIADPDAPAPEPEAGRFKLWLVDKLGTALCVSPLDGALALARKYDFTAPQNAPHLAILAPDADAARKKYAEQVAGGEDATQATVEALRGEVATLKHERDKDALTIAYLRLLCGEAARLSRRMTPTTTIGEVAPLMARLDAAAAGKPPV